MPHSVAGACLAHPTAIALLTLAVTGHALSAQGNTPGSANTDIPVSSVMLFSSGVGYFEHAGIIRNTTTTELRFKTAQINDILKSLVVRDQDGGQVAAIHYPAQDPIAKTLRSFQIDITNNPGLPEFLNQLRGARVSITAQAEQLTGTILGVETTRITVGAGEFRNLATLNLLSGATIRSIELPRITSLTLDDAQLHKELTNALSALSQARDKDKKPVTIRFTGTGNRRVRIGYVVETPVWKTSYRLLLNKQESRLQGWAIVENQTESDWTDVSLSLVSGRPISFAMDLYQPLYATRPTVTPQLFEGLRPQRYDDGISGTRERVNMQMAAPNAPLPARMDVASKSASADTTASGPRRLGDGVNRLAEMVFNAPTAPFSHVVALAAQMGELFEYAVPHVTLARQTSAMLPIVADAVSVERVSIYNADVLPSHPLNGVRLKNTTGKHLLQGPLTVIDDGGYAGDAQIEDIPPGQQRYLSYGVDLKMHVTPPEPRTVQSLLTGKIANGVLSLDHKVVNTHEYELDNKGDTDKQVVIEHAIDPGATLVDTPKPIETTPQYYRFQGTATAHKVTTLTVKQEFVYTQTVALLTSAATDLMAVSKGGRLPAAVRDAIIKVAALKQAVTETDRLIAERTKELADISTEQSRLRENMRTVGQTTAYYQRLLEKLNEQESHIERIQSERSALQAKRDSQHVELGAFTASLSVGA